MAKTRDYAAEYKRRVRNATARGLTRDQARGHPGAQHRSASSLRSGSKPAKVDPKLEAAISAMRDGSTLSQAARDLHVGRERLAAYAKRYAGASAKGGRWVFDDMRVRRVPMAAIGEDNFLTLNVPGFDPAHLAGLHYVEALKLLENPGLQAEFRERWSGVSIFDLKGGRHYFQTDFNTLFRTHLSEDVDWTRIYQITMP